MTENTPTITEELTKRVATLARLELTPQEVSTFTQQIKDILQYVSKLDQVDVTGVEPLSHPVKTVSFLREDTVVNPLLNEDGKPKILNAAPDVLYEGYKVPQII